MGIKVVICGKSESSTQKLKNIIIPPDESLLLMMRGDKIKTLAGYTLVVVDREFAQVDDKFNYKMNIYVAEVL